MMHDQEKQYQSTCNSILMRRKRRTFCYSEKKTIKKRVSAGYSLFEMQTRFFLIHGVNMRTYANTIKMILTVHVYLKNV